MTKKVFDSIAAGLHDALLMAQGSKRAGKLVSVSVFPADVKKARKKVGLSREEFAQTFGLSAATLRKWENGERQPTGAARALLTIIAREPEAVLRAIRK
ncbi:MAG: helix-turn-helix domain-containing protein [Alphaproteobacteria bacterium]|nr:helix-turn-helix domain-containing protein [Alphaproteobacteria bacterium]